MAWTGTADQLHGYVFFFWRLWRVIRIATRNINYELKNYSHLFKFSIYLAEKYILSANNHSFSLKKYSFCLSVDCAARGDRTTRPPLATCVLLIDYKHLGYVSYESFL